MHNQIDIGDKVNCDGKEYTVLGFAASEDDDGFPLIEIAWNDQDASPTGYLAVPRSDLIKMVKVEEVEPHPDEHPFWRFRG